MESIYYGACCWSVCDGYRMVIVDDTIQARGASQNFGVHTAGMEEGKGGERYLASGRQYGNALLGVRHQEEEEGTQHCIKLGLMATAALFNGEGQHSTHL